MEEKVNSKPHTPPGVRLCNPLNIKKSSSQWQGMIPNNKGSFCQFKSFYYGWRAAIIIMARTYYNRGWNTPKLIIEHWAPYTENNTRVYLAFVCKYAELDQNKIMPPIQNNKMLWRRMLIAMAKIEIGYRFVTEEVVKELDQALNVVNYW